MTSILWVIAKGVGCSGLRDSYQREEKLACENNQGRSYSRFETIFTIAQSAKQKARSVLIFSPMGHNCMKSGRINLAGEGARSIKGVLLYIVEND